jgi:hypothetical protein
MLERRRCQRDNLMEIVDYVPSPYSSDIILRGLIKDFSHSGICLIAARPLEKGQEIMVDSIIIPYSKKVTVRWQQIIGSATYKVGLEFGR